MKMLTVDVGRQIKPFGDLFNLFFEDFIHAVVG